MMNARAHHMKGGGVGVAPTIGPWSLAMSIQAKSHYEVLANLRLVFPNGRFPNPDVEEGKHEYYVEGRFHLPSLMPQAVVEWLPGILYDLIESGQEAFAREHGDMVIYFLNVCANPFAMAGNDVPHLREAAIDAFGEQDGANLMDLLQTPLSPHWTEHALEKKAQQAYWIARREDAFRLFSSAQSCAVYECLRLIRTWPDAAWYGRDLEQALEYWRCRCEGTREGASE